MSLGEKVMGASAFTLTLFAVLMSSNTCATPDPIPHKPVPPVVDQAAPAPPPKDDAVERVRSLHDDVRALKEFVLKNPDK